MGANLRVVPVEGSDSVRARRFARGPSDETVLQFVERIGDAYGLVLVLILTTFVVTMTLAPAGLGRAGRGGRDRRADRDHRADEFGCATRAGAA